MQLKTMLHPIFEDFFLQNWSQMKVAGIYLNASDDMK